MFAKWIACRVKAENRGPFSEAQRAWATIAGVPGFLGQVGGWAGGAGSKSNEQEAAILAIWRDGTSYRRFMATQHDEVTKANRQEVTYEGISVDELEHVREYAGASPSFPEAIRAEIALLRVAACEVRSGREAHFEEVQEAMWVPGMNSTGAVQATIMASSDSRPGRYVVASLWSDVDAHGRYVETLLPVLRERSQVAETVAELRGHLVQLEPTWTILPAEAW